MPCRLDAYIALRSDQSLPSLPMLMASLTSQELQELLTLFSVFDWSEIMLLCLLFVLPSKGSPLVVSAPADPQAH